MKKVISGFMLFVLLTSCSRPLLLADVQKINGYWEIEKVIFPDGNKKDYTISETIDYFEIKDTLGFRKKAKPQLDGKYIVNPHAERLSVSFKDGTAFLRYATEYAKWMEEIVEISDEHLILKNDNGVEYHYKKPIPFTIK
jgi:hypothetical protein